MKRIPRKRKIYRSKSYSQIVSSRHTFLALSSAVILGILFSSIYLAFYTGAGPLSPYFTKSKVMLVQSVDPCIAACKASTYACSSCKSANANVKPTTIATSVILSSKATCEKRSNSTQSCKYTTTCVCKKITKEEDESPAVTPAVTQSVSQVIPPVKTCNVAPGINIEINKYAATGRGLDASGNVCTQNGCPARECVQIKPDCSHGPSVKCHEQNLAVPGSVILPTAAGPEYTVGMTAEQVKSAVAKGQKLPDPPKGQCHDRNGLGVWIIVTDGSRKIDDPIQVCRNGSWKVEPMVEIDYALNKIKAEQDRIMNLITACKAEGKHYIGEKCITQSELDLLIADCQKDEGRVLDLVSGVCIGELPFTRPPENKLVSGDNCNTEQIIENQKVYIDCSTPFPVIKFCTGGYFDADHNCIMPTLPVTTTSNTTSNSVIIPNTANSSNRQSDSSSVAINYFNQNNYGSEKVSGGGDWSTAGCGIMSGAMILSLVDKNADPYDYNQLLSQHGGVTYKGTGWFDQHKIILEENNFEVVPVYGSVTQKQNQIESFTNEGVPVWINAYIATETGEWVGHHTLAVGIDQSTGDIILNDPYYGENYHMPIERIDVDCSKSHCGNGSTGWVTNAIIPPEGNL